MEPISVEDARLHLRATESVEDAYIADLITAARQTVERRCSRSFYDRTLELVLDRFPSCDEIRLLFGPVSSVPSITYLDADGVSQTFAAASYVLDSTSVHPRVVLADGESWPETQAHPNAVTIRYVAGYGTDSVDIPADLRHAVRFLVGHWYANREAVVVGTISSQVAETLESLIYPLLIMEV